jgi:hypothetical protein
MNKKISVLILSLFSIFTSSFGQNIPNYVPTNGLIGWWPFNGNVNDISGNGFNGMVDDASFSTDRDGNEKSAYYFDGENNSIYIGSIPKGKFNTHQFSYSIWVNLKDSKDCQQIINFNNTINLHKTIYYENSITLSDGYVHSIDVKDESIKFGKWYNITTTYDLNIINVYLNGVNIYLGSTWDNESINYDVTAFRLGSLDDELNLWRVNGKIDDLAIFNRVLTQQEVSNLYNGNTPYNPFNTITPAQSYGIEPTPQESKGGTQSIRVNPDDI